MLLKTLLSGLVICLCLLPLPAGAKSKLSFAKKADGVAFIVDLSVESSPDRLTAPCAGLDRYHSVIELLNRISDDLPEMIFQMSLRADLPGKSLDQSREPTQLLWGPDTFNRQKLVDAVARLPEQPTTSPLLEEALEAASREELAKMHGRRALVIFSDFRPINGSDRSIKKAKSLKSAFGQNLCIYTIGFSSQAPNVEKAESMAAAGKCGNYYDGCQLLNDKKYFQAMLKEIFYYQFAESDDDSDGVPNSIDRCHQTPIGAEVDERGCWMGAYDAFFDTGKWEIKTTYIPFLQRVAEVMLAYPELLVRLEGHTDNVGSHKSNLDLGLKRALAVRTALLSLGVPVKQMKFISYGDSKPIATNATPAGRAKNRRVEITVLKPARRNKAAVTGSN